MSSSLSTGQGLLSVVIPAYEEQGNIALTLERLRSGLADALGPRPVEIIVVDDGSRDETVRRAAEGGADRVISLGRNRGKGAAVRTGILATEGSVVAYTDADGPYRVEVLADLVGMVDSGSAAAIGVRRHHTNSLKRRVGNRLVSALVGVIVLGRGHPDSQCGLKVIEGDVARAVFGKCRVERFGFDAEVILMLDRLKADVATLEVEALPPIRKSKVRAVRDGLQMLLDLLRIRRRARLGLYEMVQDPPGLTGR